MVTSPTKLYELQVTGTNAGTWGDVLNDDVFTIIDNNLGGVTSLSLSSTPVSLSASQAQMGMLIFTGTISANIAVTSANIGVYWVENRTSGDFYVSLTNGTGNAMLVPQGAGRQVWADSTYGVRALNLPPPGSFLDLGATTPHPSLLATTSLVGEYLLCDGTSFLTTGVTANLYAAIGTTWGAGPLLPDLRNRARFGKWTAGSGGSQRITSAGSSIDGATVGSAGGAQTVTLVQADLPSAVLSLTGSGAVTTGGVQILAPPFNAAAFNVVSSGAVPIYAQAAMGFCTATVTGTTSNINGGVSQTSPSKMPPAAITNVLIKI